MRKQTLLPTYFKNCTSRDRCIWTKMVTCNFLHFASRWRIREARGWRRTGLVQGPQGRPSRFVPGKLRRSDSDVNKLRESRTTYGNYPQVGECITASSRQEAVTQCRNDLNVCTSRWVSVGVTFISNLPREHSKVSFPGWGLFGVELYRDVEL